MKKKTHRHNIRKHLKSGKTLTQLQATNLWGCIRLAPNIKRLKEEGLIIECDRSKGYGVYKLVKSMNGNCHGVGVANPFG